ncbi:DNA helicase IV [Escherichia coli]|nr:DNA helicase IV [Escherichia coli]
MELKATTLGKRLAQHPYDRAVILNAGIKVSGDRHEYLIPFINYWRFTVNAVWYGASWNLYCRAKKWCVCTVPNGARRSVFTIILMLTGGGGVAR